MRTVKKTEKKRRGEHPRSLANLVTWQPGQTGNPGGRPKKKPIADRYHRIVETELPDDIRRALDLPRGATFGDAVALAQVRQAIKGETAAAKEIREAIEGRSITGVALVALWLRSTTIRAGPLVSFVVFIGPLLICFSFSRRPLRFALGFGSLLLASGLYSGQYGRLLLTERSFFGVYRVSEDGGNRQLIHGSTVHGVQSMNPARSREPLAYYYNGPIGQVFRSPTISPKLQEVAVIGLGAGSLACYGEPGRHFTFYEIDPTVEGIARNPRYFTFLRDCSPGTAIVIGDARLSLQSERAHKYDMVVVDAFSSDTVPVHLVTREAIELYLGKLTDHGILAFNISNRYLDMRPVLGELAHDAELVSIVQEDLNIDTYEQNRGKFPSTWVLMARQRSDFASLASRPNWYDVELPSGGRLWTDDYSSLISIIHWN